MSFLAEFFQVKVCKWPSCTPDLSLLDFFLCSYLKNIVHKNAPQSIAELKKKIEDAIKPHIHVANVWANAFVPQLRSHSYWRPRVTKRTGTSVFVVRSLGIFRHFQNFPWNSLFSGKIREETLGLVWTIILELDPDFRWKLFPEPPKIAQWQIWTEQMFAHTYTFVQRLSRKSFNVRSFTAYSANIGKLRTGITERIRSRLLQRLHLVNAHVRLCLVKHIR